MNEFYALLTGLLLRIGIPILFTGGLVYLLNRLDARWQEEAMQQHRPDTLAGKTPKATAAQQLPCWEQKSCPPGQMAGCPATKSTEPCWQVLRASNGYLAQQCLDCEVFRNAPILAPAQS